MRLKGNVIPWGEIENVSVKHRRLIVLMKDNPSDKEYQTLMPWSPRWFVSDIVVALAGAELSREKLKMELEKYVQVVERKYF
ncbi:MAG: hypothetical protein OEZ58_05745 [Gammaproteobacteria bacterium]|nr:hypothetical protein [Gammaproteobacteria bacterium]MDH5728470.1 hypothetical protein [Gammaproteobacteria bacterium]